MKKTTSTGVYKKGGRGQVNKLSEGRWRVGLRVGHKWHKFKFLRSLSLFVAKSRSPFILLHSQLSILPFSPFPQVPLCQRADVLHGLTFAQCSTIASKKLFNQIQNRARMDAFQGSGPVTPSHSLMEKNFQKSDPSQNPSQSGTRPVTKPDSRPISSAQTSLCQ
jgi:hypothetical protein